MINFADVIGFVAGTCTTLAFIPQVVQVLRTRSTKDISLGMYIVFTSGCVLWLTYGIMAVAWPLIIANAITSSLAGAILLMKIRNDVLPGKKTG